MKLTKGLGGLNKKLKDDKHFDEMKEYLRRDRLSKALPGQQGRPEEQDAYNDESSESKDVFTVNRGISVTRFRKQREMEPYLVQLPRIGWQENNPTTVSRPIESDHSRRYCPHKRDPPRGVSFDGEPVWRSAGFKDDAKTVDQEEVTSMSSDSKGRRNCPRWLNCMLQGHDLKWSSICFSQGTMWRSPLRTRTSSLVMLESRIFAPCRQDRFLYEGGLINIKIRAVLLWFAGLGMFSCGTFS